MSSQIHPNVPMKSLYVFSRRVKGERDAGHKGIREVGNVDLQKEITFQYGANEPGAEGERTEYTPLVCLLNGFLKRHCTDTYMFLFKLQSKTSCAFQCLHQLLATLCITSCKSDTHKEMDRGCCE